ncbi:hypothetical protein JL721_7321 [Aureococcus anophagefferens]|nr:hypothetical protein JL721_7321 [Aureococcus anophagefferens]
MSSRVERDEQLKVEARRKFAEQEEHEVRIQTRDIKQLMDDYLRTKHGRQELLHVADAMRREQERAEALKKKQEQEAEEEKKRAAAEEKELEKAYKQREKKEASKKKAQNKAREKLRRKGLLAEDAPTAEMFEEKFFDVSLTEVPEKKRKRIIQELRAVTRFSLKQATDAAAERVPWTIKSSLTREAADAVVKRLSRAGAGVELVAGKKPAADEASVDSKEADVQFLEAQREKRMLERKKRAAVNMAGVEAADKERQQVQATFSVFDADNSGAIDVGELEGLLKELCIPVKDKDELHAIMTELDGDGSGDIDFHEFYMWFKQVGESKKGGIIGNALSASLAVQKFGNAMAGATRMLEAKRVIIACAEHDAAQHARLLFRQSRPDEGHDGDEVAREVAVDLAAEKRFSAVRAVVGRPTQDGGGGGDNELVPPHWMNADRPGLSDPFDEAGDAVKLGAKIHGVDPTAGERAAPRASDGMRGMTRHHFLNGKPEKQAPGPGSTFARAIVALRKDIAFPDAARLRPETDAPGVEVVPEGAMKALATFAWRPDMEPRPRRNVSIEAEFTGWKPARLQPSRKRHGAYELEFALPPGRYRYGFRVDGEHHVDPLAPIARTGNGSYNVLHVLAYHRSKQNDALSPPKPKRGEPLEICLNGHRLKDDGAWALADAIRSGGGGGALRVLALQANGLSGDGVGSLCTALASGAALKLESLDLSKNRIGVEGGRAVGLLLSEKWDGNADDADRAVAVGVVGNGTLRNLDLNENGVGEFGCAALARALLRNGVLQSLSLAGNRVDAEGAKHLSVPVRISGALRRLELANNQAVGSLGAYHLGEALAGGSPDLLRRVAAEEEAARHRRGEISIKTLAISGVGSDDDDDDDYKRVGNVDSAASASANNNLRGIIKLKAKANAVKNKAKRKIVRSGALDYLGLAGCSMCREGDRRGIVAVCDGLQRSAKSQDHNRLKFVSLRGNPAISPEWMWRDHAMPATENDAEAQRTGQLDMLVTVPSIATSIELTRRAVAEHERQQALFLARERRKKDRKMGGGDAKPARARPPSRPTTPGSEFQGTEPSGSDGEGEPRAAGSQVDGGDSTTLSTMTASQVEKRASFNRRASRRASMAQRRAARDAIKKPVVEEEDVAEEVDEGIIAPPPPADPKSGKLEGEWTAASGWFRMATSTPRAVRREEALRANEYARIQCEKDAVEAAGAAAAARANLAAARVPDGPKLVEAVARELAEVTKAQQLAAAKVARSRRGAQTDRTIMQEGAAEVEQTRAKKLQKMISGAGAGDGDGGGEAATAAAAEQTLVADKLALARDRAAIAAIKKAAKDKKREGYREAEKSRIKAIFQRVDTDDSGTVDSFELKALLIRLGWVSVTPKQIRETMKELDRDASGEIDFDELSSCSKGERGGVFDPLLQDAVRALEADASYEATKRAKADFRKRRPPRDACVCLVCGEACVDHVNHSLHVAIAARAKEGRAAKKKMSRSEKKKEKKKKEEETRPPFPVLVVYDPRVPHHIEIQTYDIPDKHHGRPTGAVSLLTSALYCIADGLGNDLVTKGAGSEWLRVVWPSHAAAGGGEDASLTTAAAMYGAIHGGPMPRVSRDDDGPPRAVVRSIPEVYSAVIGELRWGYALLAYGKARNWLLVAYGPRDNAWLLFKAPTRPFVQQVISTVELTDLRHVGYSPQLVEEGAADRVTGERAKTMGEKAASLAARAETEDIDDDELAAIGDGRKEAPLVKPDADDDASVVTDRPETGRPETGATTMTRPETGRPETGQSSRPTTGEEGGRPQTTTPVGSSG